MSQRTLVLIKSDGVKRNLIGKIINYYEEGGLKIAALKMLDAQEDILKKHYPEDEEYMVSLGKKSEKAGDKIDNYMEQGRMIVVGLRKYMMEGPIVAMILEGGEDTIAKVRQITGYTDPSSADKGTIRGDLGEDTILEANRDNRPVYNLIHASGNPEEAEKEIAIWFPELA